MERFRAEEAWRLHFEKAYSLGLIGRAETLVQLLFRLFSCTFDLLASLISSDIIFIACLSSLFTLLNVFVRFEHLQKPGFRLLNKLSAKSFLTLELV